MEVMISPKSIHHLNLLPINTYMDMVSSIVEVKWTMYIITVIRSSETIIKVIEYNSYTLKFLPVFFLGLPLTGGTAITGSTSPNSSGSATKQ